MSKSKRLLELMMTVNRKRKFTVKELASQFGVSSRTILRDLQELSELGVPLYSEVGPHGGYQVLHDRVLPPITFTESEALSIFFAVFALRHYSSLPFASESSSALHKFFSFLPNDLKDRIEQMKYRVDFHVPKRQQTCSSLDLLLDAAIEQKLVTIEYHSGNKLSRRDIQPIGIYAYDGFWFCPAYCHLRREYRLFRADRIRSVTFTEHVADQAREGDDRENDTYRNHAELSEVDLTNWVIRHIHNMERVSFIIELSSTGVRRYQEEVWMWTMPELDIKADGKGMIRGTVPMQELDFFSDYWFRYGKHAIVKEPKELADKVRRQFAEALQQYES